MSIGDCEGIKTDRIVEAPAVAALDLLRQHANNQRALARASWYGDYCPDCRRWFNYDQLREVRDRALGSTVRVCGTCARKRRRLRSALVLVALLAVAGLLAYSLRGLLDDPAAKGVFDGLRTPQPPDVLDVGIRRVPRVDETSLLRRLNAQRSAAGLRPLARDRAASLLAMHHSAAMADAGRLSRVPASDLRPFRYAGDVHQTEFHHAGGSVPRTRAQVLDAILRDSARRRSILGRYDRVGVGIEQRPGNLWVTLIFISA